MQFKDYYSVLDVPRDAAQDELKRSYRKLARRYHPDVSKEADAENKFKELNEAYEVLKDPEKREAYDRLGSNWQQGQEFKPPPEWDKNFEFSGGGFTDQDPSAFSDFFENLFGARSNAAGNRREGFANKRQDQYAKIVIDLEDAFNAPTKSISLERSFINSDGRPVSKLQKIKVKIPKGVCAGQHIRLRGQGAPDRSGRQGDLYLEVEFRPHRVYRVDGHNLELDLPLAPWEAALGALVRVPTPSGPVDLKISANTKADQKLRLKGRGIPAKNKAGVGDLTVVTKIVLPESGSKIADELYRKMQRDLSFNPRAKLGV